MRDDPRSRVICVCAEAPWPTNTGPRHVTDSLLRGLASRWRCSVVGFSKDTEEDACWNHFIRTLAEPPRLYLYRRTAGRALAWRRTAAILSLNLPSTEAFASSVANEKIQELCALSDVHSVWFDSFNVARHVAAAAGNATVLIPYDAFSMMATRDFRLVRSVRGRLRALWRLSAFLRLERRVYRRFSVVAPVSSVDTSWLVRRAQLSHVRTLGIAVPEHFFEPATNELPSDGGAGIVVVGSFVVESVRAGLEEWLKTVLPQVRKELQTVPVTVWGKGSENLQSQLTQIGVRVISHVDDYLAFLRQTPLVVYPQRSGSGLQTKLQEAMACSRPVVARRATLEPLGAVHGIHALAADDNREMAACICGLWRNRALRARLGQAASRLIRETYAEDKIGWQLEQIAHLAQSLRAARGSCG